MSLPDEVVARIRAKERKAEEKKQEQRELKEKGLELKDEQRHAELRAIPLADRTEDERRELVKLQARKRRAEERATQTVEISRTISQEEFWASNIAAHSPKSQIAEWLEMQERVLDSIHWMAHGAEVDPADQDFVSFPEGWNDLRDFTTQSAALGVGMIHDDVYNDHELNDVTPNHTVWENYWRDPQRLQLLCAENEATKIFALTGIRVAFPAYHCRMFAQAAKNHQNAKLVGWDAHKKYDDCWQCRFEQAQAARQAEARAASPQAVVEQVALPPSSEATTFESGDAGLIPAQGE